MKHSGKSPRAAGGYGNPKKSDARKDRRSGTGMSGSPKKGGHGGKFTWSGDALFSEAEMGLQRPLEAVDVKDPNFEDPDDNDVYDIDRTIKTAA
ncbi:hypothetical protein CRG98_003323 [Punica granatum]|uniref:Programmed cell death protein 4-like n=1 Tax=Punica granatum TaxID=22663 RepID=A0A2I0L683_PUNGR|nr:hypothetical protein CRG98_003323 [Punica granatum]